MPAKDTPLQVVATKEQRARIQAIAARDKVSMGQVIRDLVDHGLPWREQLR